MWEETPSTMIISMKKNFNNIVNSLSTGFAISTYLFLVHKILVCACTYGVINMHLNWVHEMYGRVDPN